MAATNSANAACVTGCRSIENGATATGWIGRWLDGLAGDELFRAASVGQGLPLHLIGDSSPETGAAAGVDARRLHFAIRVASFQAALAWLEERGFRENAPAGDPSRLVVLPNSVVGYPQLYLLDPDRHLIEINAERLDG